MATGTGKTFVAMQIVWKLWKSAWRPGRNPRILYLADRNILIDQPIEREFKPAFGTGEGSPIWKLQGEAKRGREIYFGLYQQLADSGADLNGMFREFAPDFFDLVIVDECHRGSARAESSWRAILDHFSPATQLGMTATPRRDETADTLRLLRRRPLFEYSLAQGIDDGFLAPYRVRRVVLSPDAHGWAPDQGQLDLFGKEIPDGSVHHEGLRARRLAADPNRGRRQAPDGLPAATDRMGQDDRVLRQPGARRPDAASAAQRQRRPGEAAPQLRRAHRQRRGRHRPGPPQRLRRHRERTCR